MIDGYFFKVQEIFSNDISGRHLKNPFVAVDVNAPIRVDSNHVITVYDMSTNLEETAQEEKILHCHETKTTGHDAGELRGRLDLKDFTGHKLLCDGSEIMENRVFNS
uniref:Uncharacterized protein n=1 Tax=Glossina austeni TaxID=7395 RepID=A0A1A9V4G9_GLOAU